MSGEVSYTTETFDIVMIALNLISHPINVVVANFRQFVRSTWRTTTIRHSKGPASRSLVEKSKFSQSCHRGRGF